MYGGEGSDHLIGGAFGESLDGGPGDDRVFAITTAENPLLAGEAQAAFRLLLLVAAVTTHTL